jgi:regulator of protease activity HflC (stomatin/prohibitin superfamily)
MSRFAQLDFKAIRAKLERNLPSLKWREISMVVAWALLAALPLLGMAVGWEGAQIKGAWQIGFLGGIGLVIVATSLFAAGLFQHSLTASLANSLAPLFMNRYGVKERARAEKLLYAYATNPTVNPEFRVVEGALRDDVQDAPKRQTNEKHDETPSEFFQRTYLGPATLWIDRESAVLIEYGGEVKNDNVGNLVVRSDGKCELSKGDRLKGIVHLRPQRELVEIKGALTRDTVALDLQVAITYQIRQDMQHLEQNQAHRADIEDVRRALLPRDEWRQRTKAQLTLQIHQVLRECELWQLFLAPPQPPAPAAIAALYTLGQSIVPASTRLELENRVKTRLNEVCPKWGVEVTRVSFEQITPPPQLRDAAQRAYVTWTRLTEELLEAEKEAQAALRIAQVKHEQAKVEQETQQLKAEGSKAEKILDAAGEAEAYNKRMQARADGALTFARRIETLRQAMGNSLDEKTFRELLRALDLLHEDKDEKEDNGASALVNFLVRERYGRNAQ